MSMRSVAATEVTVLQKKMDAVNSKIDECQTAGDIIRESSFSPNDLLLISFEAPEANAEAFVSFHFAPPPLFYCRPFFFFFAVRPARSDSEMVARMRQDVESMRHQQDAARTRIRELDEKIRAAEADQSELFSPLNSLRRQKRRK
jgi:hypothetical protein